MTSMSVPAYMAVRRAKETSAFAILYYGFPYICPYRFLSVVEVGQQKMSKCYYESLKSQLYIKKASMNTDFGQLTHCTTQ